MFTFLPVVHVLSRVKPKNESYFSTLFGLVYWSIATGYYAFLLSLLLTSTVMLVQKQNGLLQFFKFCPHDKVYNQSIAKL